MWWWHASVIPVVREKINRRITIQADLGINMRPYSKDTYSKYKKQSWGCDSSVKSTWLASPKP
jgi:hypothetical protein